MLRNYLIIFFSALTTTYSFGQEYFNIADEGSHVIDCSIDSILVTASTDTPTGYYTISFCLEDGEEGNLEVFISPALYGDIWNINDNSGLTIFDGANTSAPLLGGGSFNSINAPNGVLVRSTNSCITLGYYKQSSSTVQQFTAHVQCETSYQPYLAEFSATPEFQITEIDSLSIGICLSDTFTISANISYLLNDTSGIGLMESDTTTYFNWQMGDGNTQMGYGMNEISYAYSGGTGHEISLYITSSSGTTQSHRFSVLQSPRPIFSNIVLNDTICIESETVISGGINYSELDTVGVSPGIGSIPTGTTYTGSSYIFDAYLPECDSDFSVLVVNEFEEGQTLNNVSDILNICVNMHHTYMGDLEMGLVCPDGQDTLVLFDLRNLNGQCPNLFSGGIDAGNRNLGEPLGFGNPISIGYDYCFNNNPEYGTFATVNTDLAPELPMPAGSYDPMSPMEDLIGCPLNGEWELVFFDGFQGDIGVINSWSIFFNPEITPSTQYYSPAIVSAGWDENPDLTVNEDSTSVTVTPTGVGNNAFVFWAYDEFGCRHDTTINIYAISEVNLDDSQDCGLSQILSPYNGLNESVNNVEFTVVIPPTSSADISFEQIAPGSYLATASEFGIYNVMITSPECGYSGFANLNFLEENNPACITGIRDININKEFIIAPNPAANFAEVKFEIKKAQVVQIAVSTMDGQVISNTKLNLAPGAQNERINLEKLEAGAYLVIINGETFKAAEFLIKQ